MFIQRAAVAVTHRLAPWAKQQRTMQMRHATTPYNHYDTKVNRREWKREGN